MNTVYAVSSGSYSDYHIEAVFSTREKAQAYIDSFGELPSYDVKDIEEWGLDPECIKPRDGYTWYNVHLSIKTGDVLRIDRRSQQVEWFTGPSEEFGHQFLVDTVARSGYPWDVALEGHIEVDGKQRLVSIYSCNVEARDEKHAIKIANERRIGYILSHPYGKDLADGLNIDAAD